jgi:uncharacterized membrane protein YeaQ/YmgE (transglycosylase-associated protein family)
MMNLIVWLVIGTLVGWVAGQVLNDRDGTPFHIIIGIIGAMIGGVLIGGVLMGYDIIMQDAFDLTTVVVAFISAVVLLAGVTLMRHMRARAH